MMSNLARVVEMHFRDNALVCKVVSLPIDHAFDASKISCKYKINMMIKRTQTAQCNPACFL